MSLNHDYKEIHYQSPCLLNILPMTFESPSVIRSAVDGAGGSGQCRLARMQSSPPCGPATSDYPQISRDDRCLSFQW